MESGLNELIKYVRGIPSAILQYMKGKRTKGDRDSAMYEWLTEQLQERLRRIRYYDDEWQLEPGRCLAHYTSWSCVLEILKQDKPVMRMYNYETANDPLEGRVHPKEWDDVVEEAEWLEEYGGSNMNEPNVCSTYGYSFSSGDKVDDNLTLWRLYGNDGEGCSFMISARMRDMYRIRYRRQDGESRSDDERREDKWVAGQIQELLKVGRKAVKKVDNRHRQGVGKVVHMAVMQVLDGYCHLVKDTAYFEEQEWRQVAVRPTAESIRYDVEGARVRRYVEGPLMSAFLTSASRITIGPKVYNPDAARSYVYKMIREKGIYYCDVKKSLKRYR